MSANEIARIPSHDGKNEMWQDLYDLMKEGYLSLDQEFYIIDSNRSFEQMVGYSRDELRRMTFLDITPTKWLGTERDALGSRSLEPGFAANYEKELLRRDGSLVPVDVSLYAAADSKTLKVTGFRVLVKDITEKKRSEEQRARQESRTLQSQKIESLGLFAAGIAHDFNNLLTGIVGHASLALAKMSEVAPGRENIEMIDKSAQRLTDLTRQLLAFSGQGKYVIKPISLSMLIEEMEYMLKNNLAAPNAHLVFNLDPNVPIVDADAGQLRQVIANLVSNASEALGDKGGVIRVNTGSRYCDKGYLSSGSLTNELPEGMYVFVEVVDAGCGMDQATVMRMFDPFFSTKFAGRGLGLAAVLGIVRGHGGACKIMSQVGKGSTFTILLPKSEKSISRNHGDLAKPRFQGLALVVDDEETVRDIAKTTLEENGFTVLTANDGEEAIQLFRSNADKISCVLLDMTMPEMNGEDTYRELKRIKDNVKVILSSGYNEAEHNNRFLEEGISGFLNKPYRQEELLSKVEEVLSNGKSFH